jgi:hypothetical protein
MGDTSQEFPVQTSYVASAEHPRQLTAFAPSRDLAAVILFCLLGLTISAACISYLGAEIVGPILAQLQ